MAIRGRHIPLGLLILSGGEVGTNHGVYIYKIYVLLGELFDGGWLWLYEDIYFYGSLFLGFCEGGSTKILFLSESRVRQRIRLCESFMCVLVSVRRMYFE